MPDTPIPRLHLGIPVTTTSRDAAESLRSQAGSMRETSPPSEIA